MRHLIDRRDLIKPFAIQYPSTPLRFANNIYTNTSAEILSSAKEEPTVVTPEHMLETLFPELAEFEKKFIQELLAVFLQPPPRFKPRSICLCFRSW